MRIKKDLWLIAGLGNPGARYEKTWHNSGYQVIDQLACRHNIVCRRTRFQSVTGQGRIGSARCLLVKPLTYMNRSGEAIREAIQYYAIDYAQCLVIYDDIDLPLGSLRIRRNGGPGTHNGMRSIIDHVENDDFPRVRIGIGPKPEDLDLADFVLSTVPNACFEIWQNTIQSAAEAVDIIVQQGLEPAMSLFNNR
jgi:peptidyl-tRNA hydrolase, PTH1 family